MLFSSDDTNSQNSDDGVLIRKNNKIAAKNQLYTRTAVPKRQKKSTKVSERHADSQMA